MSLFKRKNSKIKLRQEKLEELYQATKRMMVSLQVRHHAANQDGYRVPAHLLQPQIEVDKILGEIEDIDE